MANATRRRIGDGGDGDDDSFRFKFTKQAHGATNRRAGRANIVNENKISALQVPPAEASSNAEVAPAVALPFGRGQRDLRRSVFFGQRAHQRRIEMSRDACGHDMRMIDPAIHAALPRHGHWNDDGIFRIHHFSAGDCMREQAAELSSNRRPTVVLEAQNPVAQVVNVRTESDDGVRNGVMIATGAATCVGLFAVADGIAAACAIGIGRIGGKRGRGNSAIGGGRCVSKPVVKRTIEMIDQTSSMIVSGGLRRGGHGDSIKILAQVVIGRDLR